MFDQVFGNLEFNIGFKKRIDIEFSNKTYSIVLKLKAYEEIDGITTQQKESYNKFKDNKQDVLNKIKALLEANYPNPLDRFIPTLLLIDRDGTLALLFDDINDEDDGIVAQIYPSFKLESQNDYL